MSDESVRNARASIHAIVEGLANALGVRFVNTDEESMNEVREPAIGVIFPGIGRIVVVRTKGDGYYDSFWNGSGSQREVVASCFFAIECIKYKEER